MTEQALPKRILVVSFSQSGQLDRILDSLLAPLREAERLVVDRILLQPLPAYPFPWTFWRFLDAFPESVLLDPPALDESAFPVDQDYDLIIVGWTVWYLSPSPPVTAFLKGAAGRALLRDKPVVSVIACRSMWITAFATFRDLLLQAGGRLLDNVVLTDPGPFLATFITTPRWLLTGRQDSFLGLGPAGVGADAIRGAARWGIALKEALARGEETRGGPLLQGTGAVTADPRLVFSENAGRRIFRAWSRFVRWWGPAASLRRRPALALFVTYLVLAILVIGPLSLFLQWLVRPLLKSRHARLRAHLEEPSGSSLSRSPHP